jgi:hypothetical protein
MAVADSIDRDLTKIAALTFGDEDFADAMVTSLTVASLWRSVYAEARRRGDASLAGVAAREYVSAQKVFRELERISDLRAPPPPT